MRGVTIGSSPFLFARAGRGAGGGTAVREGAAGTPATSPQNQAMIPFDQGSKPEIEPGPSFTGVKPGASAQELGSVALPANGFIGGVLIDVETTTPGATAGTPWTGAHLIRYPFNYFEQVRLTEPNGAPLGLELSGWQTAVANIYGGYAGLPDPRDDPDFKALELEPSFTLRLPIEIAPTGLGALGNQSASAALRLTLKVLPKESTGGSDQGIYKVAPTTVPTITVRTFIELWGEPPAEDMFGRQIKQWPDYGGPGEGATAQYWSVQAGISVATAQNTIKLTRVGSQIRTLIFEFYEKTERKPANKVAPDPFEIQLDNRLFRQYSRRMLRKLMKEQVVRLKANAQDEGILAITFSKGEHRFAGENEWNSWLATLTATRLELRGPAETAGECNILTNDVSVTAPNPAERTTQVGIGGYHPPIGQTNLVAG